MELTEKQARIVELREGDGLSFGKIAELTGVKKGTVSKQYKRAKRKQELNAAAAAGDAVRTGTTPAPTPVESTAPANEASGFGGLGSASPREGSAVDHWAGVDLPPGVSPEGASKPAEALEAPAPMQAPTDAWQEPFPDDMEFGDKYAAPLPPPEAFKAGQVHLLAGFGHRDVESCPDFEETAELVGDAAQDLFLSDMEVEAANGEKITVDVHLRPKDKRKLAKAWALPLFRLSRAVGVSGPAAEIAEAAYKTFSLRKSIMVAMQTEEGAEMIANIRQGWAPEEPEEDGDAT